jgi:hypothetical protein
MPQAAWRLENRQTFQFELPNRLSSSFLSNQWNPETVKVVHPNLRNGILQTLLKIL